LVLAAGCGAHGVDVDVENDRLPVLVTVDREASARPQHILNELGHTVRRVDDELHGTASVRPEMYAPGTTHLRTSILAIWADTLTGLCVAEELAPRVPVTVEIDVHLYRPAPETGAVIGMARILKSGRSLFVAGVDFFSADDELIAVAGASFVVAPDPSVKLPPSLSVAAPPPERLLSVPLAERAGCELRGPGVAVLPRGEDGLNSSRTVNGGLITLVAEEAVLSLTPGATLSSLGLRFLQPVRVGPVVASAQEANGLAQVELRDAGSGNRLAAMATARTFAS
jgi:acyl-coenzyme A thioesterase PaaI-like protein